MKTNLINGKKPEFGNPEHIAYIKKHSEIQKIINNKNITYEKKATIDYEVISEVELTAYFKCFACENDISYRETFEDCVDGENLLFGLEGEKVIACKKCSTKYNIEDSHFVLVREEPSEDFYKFDEEIEVWNPNQIPIIFDNDLQ